MFNKKRNSGSIPPNRLKTYGLPRTDFMTNDAEMFRHTRILSL